MNINLNKPVFKFLAIASSGFLILGSVLDSIVNAIATITPVMTYIFTPAIILGCIVVHFVLRKRPLVITNSDEEIETINGINSWTIAIIVAIMLVLWIPRFLGNSNQPLTSAAENAQINKTELRSNSSNDKVKQKSMFSKEYNSKSKVKNGSLLVRILAFFNRNDDERLVILNKLEIYYGKSTNPAQTIDFIKEEYFYGLITFKDNADETIVIEDVNFDGVDDFRILSDSGASSYSYECYLYEIDRTYVRNESFSQLYNHSAVKLNKEKKEIEVSRRCTIASENETLIYKVTSHDEIELLLTQTTCTD